MIWIGLILLAVVATPLLIERNRLTMNDAARGSAPGQFAELSRGVTHYFWFGPQNGPVAVCIHGLTTPSFVWRGITKGLALMGYRTLVYDLYGRGYSDRPSGVQDRQYFLSQLNELLDREGVNGRITLFGYSMGGSIATCFAAAAPDRIERLVLLAPAGMGLTPNKIMDFIAKAPLIGDWLMLALFASFFRKGIKAESTQATNVPHVFEQQAEQLEYKGYVSAVLASRRGILTDVLRDEHRAIQAAGIPVLAIWGKEDSVIPASAIGTLAEWNRAAEHEVIPEAGHGLPYTHANQVIDLVRNHLMAKG
ncbi:alpha/beta fold hydrolase [Sulfitobacter sp.]|uniref:alpha/beta fold hydrolase n=1 Tax=unclassified Sulfitobacter TaxID=196795 RepID=UPI0025EA4EA1|nr:alpha/beta hydrolase [uncultured Sulfitobacter sp.]